MEKVNLPNFISAFLVFVLVTFSYGVMAQTDEVCSASEDGQYSFGEGDYKFNGNALAYDPKNAYWLMIFSKLVYEKEHRVVRVLTSSDKSVGGEFEKELVKPYGVNGNICRDQKENKRTQVTGLNAFTADNVKYIRGKSGQRFLANTQVLMASYTNANNGKDVILSFRGTQTLDQVGDLITDFSIALTNFNTNHLKMKKDRYRKLKEKARVHQGFKRAYNVVGDKIKKALSCTQGDDCIKFDKSKDRIWLTGHSLGGALAAYAGVALSNAGFNSNIKGIYTYGQPKVGNSAFAKLYKSNYGFDANRNFRFVNKNDPVPTMLQVGSISLKDGANKTKKKAKKLFKGKFKKVAETDLPLKYRFSPKSIYIRQGDLHSTKQKSSNDWKRDAHSSSSYIAAVKKNINMTDEAIGKLFSSNEDESAQDSD